MLLTRDDATQLLDTMAFADTLSVCLPSESLKHVRDPIALRAYNGLRCLIFPFQADENRSL